MLNKEEERRVASFLSSLKDDVDKEREETDLTPRALLWLAETAHRINTEFKIMSKAHHDLDFMYAEKLKKIKELQLELDQLKGIA